MSIIHRIEDKNAINEPQFVAELLDFKAEEFQIRRNQKGRLQICVGGIQTQESRGLLEHDEEIGKSCYLFHECSR